MTEDPRPWDSFALLLIDVQNDFWTEEMSAAFPDYENNVSRLLDQCRRKQIDIVHLRAKFKPDQSDWMVKYKFLERTPCIDGTPGAEIFSFAREEPDETVITKQTFDGFYNPALHLHLEENNKRFLLIAGLVTSVCVLLTSATAAQRGYLVAVVEDCCADEPEAHDDTLARYPFIFERVTVDQLAARRDKWARDLDRLV